MNSLLKRILPATVTNQYNGHPIAYYTLIGITLLTLGRSLIHIFAADGGASSIATIPIDTYSSEAAQAVIGMFAFWGLSQLIVGILYAVVLARYRSLISAMYVLLIVEYMVRATYIPFAKSIETVGTAPGAVANIPLMVVAMVMLVLSLQTRNKLSTKENV